MSALIVILIMKKIQKWLNIGREGVCLYAWQLFYEETCKSDTR